MSEENTEKSIVVWHPRSIRAIPDAREVTSLCLFHDRVVLCSFLCTKDREFQKRLLSTWQGKPEYEERIVFINKIEFLARQNVIRLIPADEFVSVQNDFAKSGKAILPIELLNRFRNFVKIGCAGIKNKDDGEQYAKMVEALDLSEEIVSYQASSAYNHPIITNEIYLRDSYNKTASTETLTERLAQSAICQLALPDVRAIHVDDLLDARKELKDELLEFRAGILKLTWLLHQQIQNKNDLEQIRHEADTLVDTVIKGSLLSLENRMKQHKKKTIRRMLLGTGKVLVEATKLFLPSGAAEKMISGGKGLLQLAAEIDSAKLPEDQVATYLYKLRGKLRAES